MARRLAADADQATRTSHHATRVFPVS